MKGGAIFLFLRVVISVLKKNRYQNLVVMFDGGGSNFRKSLLPEYKAQREKMPEELWEQLEAIKLLLTKTNMAYIQLVNYEADDLIASFIKQNTKNYPEATFDIFTRDKDLLQLLSENINILKYINGKITLYTQEQFYYEYNSPPSSYVDYLSLIGDSADNIEGVKGIGPVNAKILVRQFHTLENIYQQINDLSDNNKKLLESRQELALNNKKIISLKNDIPFSSLNCDFN